MAHKKARGNMFYEETGKEWFENMLICIQGVKPLNICAFEMKMDLNLCHHKLEVKNIYIYIYISSTILA